HLAWSARMQARVSNRGKHKTPITCLFYMGCKIRAQLLPDSRDAQFWRAGIFHEFPVEVHQQRWSNSVAVVLGKLYKWIFAQWDEV
ncbi:MAG: hypothetical protein WCE63_19120, partial [Acidobacteriaceae bacterium]